MRSVRRVRSRAPICETLATESLGSPVLLAATLAAAMGQVIDYRNDFERWFPKLLDAVIKELEEKK